jgi:hypothetical protein
MCMNLSVFCLFTFMSITTAVCTHTRAHTETTRNHTYKHTHIFYVCIFFLSIAVYLTLCFSSIQLPLFGQQPVVGCATRHFCWAFIASVSVCVARGCLQSTLLEWKCSRFVSVCVYVWVYTAVLTNMKCLFHMDSTLTLYIQASGHTDVHAQTDRQTQWMD